jgi:hypothetical protein
MSMRCRVNNKTTPLEVCGMTPKEEDMEAKEDTKVVEDIEAEEGVDEHLAEDKDKSSVITTDNRDTSHETVR